MRLKDLSAFCRRMGIGLRAGVDILKLLDNETRTGSPKHRETMLRLEGHIRDGHTLANSMAQEKKYFPPLLIQMVHASEMSGRMDSMFAYMANYYEQLRSTRQLFLSKISWPMFQLGMAVVLIGVVILLQAVLSPNTGYDASGTGMTGMSGFYRYCMLVTVIFGSLATLAYGLWKNWFNCHAVLMPLVQRIPTLGTALVTLGLSRLSMTLSMLLNAGVEARRATKQAFLATGNHYYIGGMDRALAAVEQGSSFGDAFAASRVLPNEFVESIRIGELSGTETESLDHLAEQYQQRSQSALQTIATVTSIAIWLGILLLLAFMIIRMALQYINMLNSFLP